MPTDPNQQNNYSYAIYGTQGGGLARFAGKTLIWIEPPDQFPEMQIGEEVPKEWDYQPANSKAREVVEN